MDANVIWGLGGLGVGIGAGWIGRGVYDRSVLRDANMSQAADRLGVLLEREAKAEKVKEVQIDVAAAIREGAAAAARAATSQQQQQQQQAPAPAPQTVVDPEFAALMKMYFDEKAKRAAA